MAAGIRAAKHGDGQSDDEGGTLPLSGTLHPYGAPMQLDEMLDDRQPEAEAAMSARDRSIPLTKPIEHKGQELGFDAHPRILDSDFDVGIHSFEDDIDAPVRRRELHGIRQKV